MTVPGCLTATLALSIWLGALALGQRLDRTLVELDTLALTTLELAAECARLQATIALGPSRRAELEGRKAALARWLTILPRPEIASHERLVERVQECCEASGFQMKNFCFKTISRPLWIGEFRELEVVNAFEGTWRQLGHFLRKLEEPGFFVRVNSFTCTPEQRPAAHRRGDPRITVALCVSTFRLDAR
jgi:hypothetical protein